VDFSAVPITVRATRNRDALMLHISLDAEKLSLNQGGGRWQGKLEIQDHFEDGTGESIGLTTSNVIELKMLPRTYDAALRDGLPFRITLQIPPGATALKLLVEDIRSSKIGTLSIRLKEVPGDLR